MSQTTIVAGNAAADSVTPHHNDLQFQPKLHYIVTSGPLAGVWRPIAAKTYGSRAQLSEASALRAAGRIVLPPDPLANAGLQSRFGALGKLLGILK